MHLILFIIKKVVMAICLMYAFDLITTSVGIGVPINLCTICFVSILGLPGLVGLSIFGKFL